MSLVVYRYIVFEHLNECTGSVKAKEKFHDLSVCLCVGIIPVCHHCCLQLSVEWFNLYCFCSVVLKSCILIKHCVSGHFSCCVLPHKALAVCVLILWNGFLSSSPSLQLMFLQPIVSSQISDHGGKDTRKGDMENKLYCLNYWDTAQVFLDVLGLAPAVLVMVIFHCLLILLTLPYD